MNSRRWSGAEPTETGRKELHDGPEGAEQHGWEDQAKQGGQMRNKEPAILNEVGRWATNGGRMVDEVRHPLPDPGGDGDGLAGPSGPGHN